MFWFSSLTTLFVFYSTSTKAQHCTTQNHELTAHLTKTVALLYMCHFPSEKCARDKMKEILFEVSTSFKSSMFCMSWRICHAVFQRKTVRYARSPNCFAFKSVLLRPYPWLEMHYQRNQSHHCRPARSTAETFKLNPFQPCARGIYFPKGIAKEQGHDKTSYKVLV